MQDRPASERGFTMMELLVAVSIAAVLFAIGVPMFRDAALGSRLSAAANNLLASVQLARSEAIKRNVNVTLCASSDGESCAGAGGWEQGWITIVDPADPDTVVQYQQGLPAAREAIVAPAASNSASAIDAASPAPFSTATAAPRAANFFTVSGMAATRVSGAPSCRTAIFKRAA